MSRLFFAFPMLVGVFVMAVAAEPGQVQPRIPVPQVPKQGPDGVDPAMPYFQVCAKECADCARICDMCSAHCGRLLAEGNKDHLTTLRLCQDCSDVCTSAARVVGRDGPFADLICKACADACKRCGDACAKHGQDAIMKRCADECRKCEKACRDMLSATPGAPTVPPNPKTGTGK